MGQNVGSESRRGRSFVVNTDKIKELKSVDSGYRVFLRNGADIPLSRSYRDALKSRMAS
jgi:DNA-binding LytR/AlgR family response regulator